MLTISKAKFWFSTPAVVLLCFGLFLPVSALISGIWAASGISGGILSFRALLQVQWTTLQIAALVGCFSTMMATTIALLIRPPDGVLKRLVLFACFFPLGVHVAFRAFGVQYLLSSEGPLATIVHKLFPFVVFDLSSLLFTRTATVIGLVHWTFPTAMLMILPTTSNINTDLLDAASLLGAPRRAIVARITLPLLLPTIILTFALVFCLAYGAFIIPAALGGLGDITLSRFIGTLFKEGQEESASVFAMIGLITPLVVFTALYSLSVWIRRRHESFT